MVKKKPKVKKNPGQKNKENGQQNKDKKKK
jgi:hypothetical protein